MRTTLGLTMAHLGGARLLHTVKTAVHDARMSAPA
jgi:hypothetical protein